MPNQAQAAQEPTTHQIYLSTVVTLLSFSTVCQNLYFTIWQPLFFSQKDKIDFKSKNNISLLLQFCILTHFINAQ